MKNLITLLFTVFSLTIYAQNVPIPNVNFKNALRNSACVDTDNDGSPDAVADTNNDGEIQVSEALAVTSLHVNNKSISSLTGIEYFTNLQILNCYHNQLTSLNVQGLANLHFLGCEYNQLTSLNVQGLANLEQLRSEYNQLTSLNVQGCTNLQYLYCNNNVIAILDAQGLTNLQSLNCGNSMITTLNAQGCTNLQYLYCTQNQLQSLNVQGCTNLQSLYCQSNQLQSLNVQGLTNLLILDCPNNNLTSLNVQGLTNLQSLNCNSNQLQSLNVQGLANFHDLNCNSNQLQSLNVQGLTNFQYLSCNSNQLQSLNVQGLTSLSILHCQSNQLQSLNVQGLTNLQSLYCQSNQLQSLNVQGLTNLQYLSCNSNQLQSLNVQGCTNLQSLNCNSNQLQSLNVQGLTNLQSLNCNQNQLSSLYIKNGKIENPLSFSSNPSLNYICCDAGQITQVQNLTTQYGNTNCAINSFCSNFAQNGILYSIQGNVTFDYNNNGCDPLDIAYPNLTFNITNGIDSSIFISNNSGHHSIPVGEGTYSITPVLQNPNYFNISPDTIQAVFPGANDTLIQNYCVTANGIHHDVEATIIPTIPARPGFNASYNIVYKNKGNQIENGNLTFTYDDSRLDFITSSLSPDYLGSDSLLWNYTNLMPFETRIITLVLNVNSPMETPPVNVGNILSFSIAIRGGQPEETYGDNNTGFRQTVVGSYDPNDKTCLEGDEITPDMVGDYVHYVIRFENTGTYAAENVVVKDIIDISKFEISTLQIVNTSHPMWTRITSGNIVEFIFENIQLPFASGSNGGYVSFKIKTKPTLTIGTQISNQASIYFDFNFPIVTNNAVTTVAVHQVTASIAQTNYICSSASLSATWLGVGSTYLWSTGETTATISGTASTAYTVTLTDTEGNTASASAGILPQSIATTTTSSPTTCGYSNGSVSTSAVGSYLWNTGQTTPAINNVPAGSYQVTVTGANGCTIVSTASVGSSQGASTLNTVSSTTCGLSNGTIAISATGFYLWSNGETTQTINNLATGTYTVTFTDTFGCTAVATATVGNVPIVTTSNTATPTTCGLNNGTVSTSATGSYLWSNGETTQNIANLTAGNYTVIVTDTYGCTAAASATVGDIPMITTSNVATPTTCGLHNGTATTSAIGSYLWNNGETTQNINNLAAGVYSVVVTDSYGCTATANATVAPSQSINTANTATPTTCGLNNGTATTSAIGSYLWSNGETTQNINNLAAGIYSVIVTDSHGCTATANATVTPSQSLATTNIATATTCGLNNGTATTSAIGSYLWSNGETTQTISDLTAGNYEVTVTDTYGCTAATSATVAPSSNPLTPPTINNNNGVLSTATGYTVQWFLNGTAITGATTSFITPTQNGDYTVQITDAQGCTTVSPVYMLTNVGVESVENNSFLVFPNPVHDLLTFRSDAVITKVEIYDALGRLMQVSTLNDNRLSVENLSNGIYFLNVYTESGVMRGRVVKE